MFAYVTYVIKAIQKSSVELKLFKFAPFDQKFSLRQTLVPDRHLNKLLLYNQVSVNEGCFLIKTSQLTA